jgi:hypothetical protein
MSELTVADLKKFLAEHQNIPDTTEISIDEPDWKLFRIIYNEDENVVVFD